MQVKEFLQLWILSKDTQQHEIPMYLCEIALDHKHGGPLIPLLQDAVERFDKHVVEFHSTNNLPVCWSRLDSMMLHRLQCNKAVDLFLFQACAPAQQGGKAF